MQQIEMICLEDLVKKNHRYRKFDSIWSFKIVEKLKKNNPNKGTVGNQFDSKIDYQTFFTPGSTPCINP